MECVESLQAEDQSCETYYDVVFLVYGENGNGVFG